MTQPEYEQARQECWEEYLREHKTTYTRTAFDFAFDRAYALGKQTETITQEEIEKAAEKAVRKEYLCEKCAWKDDCDHCGGQNTAFDCCECPADEYGNGFNAGAQFTLGKQEKDADTVIQGWVARDNNGKLYIYSDKPERYNKGLRWVLGYAFLPLSSDLFPDLTWSDEPQECEIIIKRKKNG